MDDAPSSSKHDLPSSSQAQPPSSKHDLPSSSKAQPSSSKVDLPSSSKAQPSTSMYSSIRKQANNKPKGLLTGMILKKAAPKSTSTKPTISLAGLADYGSSSSDGEGWCFVWVYLYIHGFNENVNKNFYFPIFNVFCSNNAFLNAWISFSLSIDFFSHFSFFSLNSSISGL